MTAQRLVIFTRFPEPHRTKTRLIPALGPEGAAQLQRDMTRHTLAVAREVATDRLLSVEVRFEGGDARKMAACFGNGVSYRPQGPGDLGRRMDRAFVDACREGAEQTVLIGTDCPEITPRLIRESFGRLAASDVVLGPANDGGYYLIGLQRPVSRLFVEIPWGSERVFGETMNRADELSLSVSLLETLSDVDRPNDLAVWRRVKQLSVADRAARISVVIPALNQADYLSDTLGSLRDAEDVEVIVVDGGSHDGTPEIAEREGCRLLRSPAGRALQMNAGARAASGSILLFLHADTRLPAGFDKAVRSTLGVSGVVAGAFRLRIDGVGPSLRIIEWAVGIRSGMLKLPYGDQGIFVRSDIFHSQGGFPDLPIMEDFAFVRQLRRHGRIRIARLPVITSSRRWHKLGAWRTTWINQKVMVGYYLGVSPERLAVWYSRRAEQRVNSLCEQQRPSA